MFTPEQKLMFYNTVKLSSISVSLGTPVNRSSVKH